MTTLREYRIRAGLSAFALAQKTGNSEIRVYHLERARYRPKQAEAKKFARVLGASVDELFPDGCQPEGGTP